MGCGVHNSRTRRRAQVQGLHRPRARAVLSPTGGGWSRLIARATDLGGALTDAVRAVARENPRLRDVIDRRDFNAAAAGLRVLDPLAPGPQGPLADPAHAQPRAAE